ncbi:MAG TPA: hypothetical protein VE309_06900, partial [Caulobacteraceae bacterium]|nr:hypothetical protein [Caulobacteraceae bacterium]
MVLALSAGLGLAVGSLAQVPTALTPAPHAAALPSAPPLATATKPVQPAAPRLPVQANGARLAPGTPIPPAELEAFVDGVVLQTMTTRHIAGVAVSVVQNGQVVLDKGYGFARPGRAVDPNTTL